MRKAILFLAVLGLTGSLWAADPFVGTWKLNPNKTKTTGWASAVSESSTVKIEAQGNSVNYRWDAVKPDGRTLHAEFAAKYDGKDYVVTGDPDSDTVSLSRIDANTVDYIFKKAGQMIWSERAVVSTDAATISLTVKGIDSKGKPYEAILLYSRQ